MKEFTKHIFVFNYELFNTNCFIIRGSESIFVVDTFMGPDSILDLRSVFESLRGSRRGFLINTHADYDHIWGNCSFKDCVHIGHAKCRERILNSGLDELKNFPHPEQIAGNVEILPPNVTFETEMQICDPEFRLHLIWTPGHSEDSISLFLEPFGILFAGDSLEAPLPLVPKKSEYTGLEPFLASLHKLQQLKPSLFLPSHGDRSETLLQENLHYLERLQQLRGNPPELNAYLKDGLKVGSIDPFYLDSHAENIAHVQNY